MRPPARALEREVNVTLPIERVELIPTSDTIYTDEQVAFSTRVFDRSEQVVRRAPVEARDTPDSVVATAGADGRLSLVFRSPGLHTIVATFGGKADTLAVTVVGSRKP